MGWAVWVDVVAVAVDNDVMVEPTQGGQVVWIVSTALAAGDDVVGLEPVAGSATVGCACPTVAMEDESSQLAWDGAGGGSYRQRCPVCGSYEDLDRSIAEDLLEGEGSDAGSGIDGGACFSVGPTGQFGVYEDRNDGSGCCSIGLVAVQGVLSESDQGVGLALGASAASTVGHGRKPIGTFLEGLLEDPSVCSRQQTPELVGGLVEGRLDGQEPFPVRLLFVLPADSPVVSNLAAYPGQIPSPGAGDQVGVGACRDQPGFLNHPIEGHRPLSEFFSETSLVLEEVGGLDQFLGGVGGKIHPGGCPLGRCAGPVRQGNLGEIESPEGGDLTGAEPSDVSLVVDQELFELIDEWLGGTFGR